jgi:glycosyltransferase involved in cell wall biosynthesis
MRIVIATGIYPPEVGGPALYAKGIKESLEHAGHEAPTVLFGGLRGYPSGVRHFLYTIKLWRAARRADAIFSFDTYSVGVPAAFVGLLRHIPVVIRVGGDFVWETYLERTKDLVPLPDFYRAPRPLNLKERFEVQVVAWMLHHAHLAFNTPWLREIWMKPYQLDMARTLILENVIGTRIPAGLPVGHSILLYSRQIVFKNIPAFRRVCERLQKEIPDLTLETGAITHEKLMERMKQCYAIAIPSVSEVAPNTLIDALRQGKPCILSKYSGYAERFKDMCVLVDPLDDDDMARGIRDMCDPETYARLCAAIRAYTEVRTYDDVARELLEVVKTFR